jgi:hypothetical protein
MTAGEVNGSAFLFGLGDLQGNGKRTGVAGRTVRSAKLARQISNTNGFVLSPTDNGQQQER